MAGLEADRSFNAIDLEVAVEGHEGRLHVQVDTFRPAHTCLNQLFGAAGLDPARAVFYDPAANEPPPEPTLQLESLAARLDHALKQPECGIAILRRVRLAPP
jgi:hypothetical protein